MQRCVAQKEKNAMSHFGRVIWSVTMAFLVGLLGSVTLVGLQGCGRSKVLRMSLSGQPQRSCTNPVETSILNDVRPTAVISYYNPSTLEAWTASQVEGGSLVLFQPGLSANDLSNKNLFESARQCYGQLNVGSVPPETTPQSCTSVLQQFSGLNGGLQTVRFDLDALQSGLEATINDSNGLVYYIMLLFYSGQVQSGTVTGSSVAQINGVSDVDQPGIAWVHGEINCKRFGGITTAQ